MPLLAAAGEAGSGVAVSVSAGAAWAVSARAGRAGQLSPLLLGGQWVRTPVQFLQEISLFQAVYASKADILPKNRTTDDKTNPNKRLSLFLFY